MEYVTVEFEFQVTDWREINCKLSQKTRTQNQVSDPTQERWRKYKQDTVYKEQGSLNT